VQDGEVPVGESEVMTLDEGAQDKCADCDGITDVICIAWNGCWEQVFKALLVLVMIAVALYFIFLKCIPCKLISYCGAKIGKGIDNKAKSAKRKEHKDDQASEDQLHSRL